MYNAMSIAAYIINKSNELENPINNLKLQKLLYYVQGVSLCNRHDILFEDEICDYIYGPVVKNVYEKYRYNSSSTISNIEDEKEIEEIKDEDKKLIDFVINKFKDYSAWDLVEKTCKESPSMETPEEDVISIETLKGFFENNKDCILLEQM